MNFFFWGFQTELQKNGKNGGSVFIEKKKKSSALIAFLFSINFSKILLAMLSYKSPS